MADRELINDETTRMTIQGLASIFATQEEAAAVLGVKPTRFMTFVRDNPDVMEIWERGGRIGKVSVRRKQFALADRNVGMAIWLGKQFLGQRDDPLDGKQKLDDDGRVAVPTGKGLTTEDKRELERILSKAAGNETGSAAGPGPEADPEGAGGGEPEGLHPHRLAADR
jgi:hypothetical protein